MKAKEFYHRLAFLGKTQQNWAFSCLIGKSYSDVFLENPTIDSGQKKLEELKKEYEKGTPLAHILQQSYFYGRRYYVNSDVLIPRPETEGLVERALSLSWNKALDLCTGSGIIATTLYLEKGGDIQAVDVSEKALVVAKTNSKNLGAIVKYIKGDLFSEISNTFDLIISNPPYIKREVIQNLDVGRFEPLLALDGGKDGLVLIRRIINEAPNYLNPGGYLLLEIGDDQGDETLCLAKEFCGRIEEDLAGKPRYFIGRKKEIC